MELKTYRAHSMADALSEVKKDLGKDAVILHARSFKVGGVMGVGARTMVEITASSDQRAPGPRPRAAVGANPQVTPTRVREPVLSPSATSIPAVARAYALPDFSEPGKPREPVPGQTPAARDIATPVPVVPVPSVLPRTRVGINPVDEAARATLESELASIKKLVSEVLEISRRPPTEPTTDTGPRLGGPLGGCVDALRRHGVASVWIDELVERVQADSTIGGSSQGVWRAIRSTLASMVPISPVADGVAPRRGRPRVVALVGPTGVGKTTTIAKMAADLALRHNKKVGIIAADTYRIAAVEQVKTYAGIIGLPVEVVRGPEEMAGAIGRSHGVDVVLVDTAGRSQRDSERLNELAEVIAAAEPDRVHLVLAATAAEPVLLEAAASFGVLRPTSLAFTKLDEAVALGSLINLPRSLGLGLTYLTNGQDVPDNIEVASGERVVSILLGHPSRNEQESRRPVG
ncbi:MAG: flagellar biosynthesis protein FlhF [Phycisphaeraceae bacterium]|nr:flagellar biosynthesis protein FlhF [Phycisphaeraceae bacterium]MBX3366789.1 flagellar biosynthesis protein FlhF [Phycisphaeraceae bacterium]